MQQGNTICCNKYLANAHVYSLRSWRLAIFIVMFFIHYIATAQEKSRQYERGFQISLFPGISTNGINSGSYSNKYSINIFAGLSSANRVFEIATICNVNLKGQSGFQFAGLANIIGANAFVNLTLAESRSLLKNGLEIDSKGIVISGMVNYINHNSSGILGSGAFNFVGNDFKGVQFAGLGNTVKGFSSGISLAGLYNSSENGMSGIQIGGLFNNTNGTLSGIQIGAINKASAIKGKKTNPRTELRGFQIGIVNFCKEMDGLQIGLINFGGNSLGKQIGLINFFNKKGTKERTTNGTPIGLLNIGSKGSALRIYMNELFPINLEYSTGNCLNCTYVIPTQMPYEARNKIFNQNALLLSYDFFNETWAFGYGFQKNLFNKASMLPKPANEKRLVSYGITFMHLNRSLALDKTFNMLLISHINYGIRVSGVHLFVGATLNYFVQEQSVHDVYKVGALKIDTGKIFEFSSSFWPGYRFGVHF